MRLIIHFGEIYMTTDFMVMLQIFTCVLFYWIGLDWISYKLQVTNDNIHD